jgi:hypothetical protein
MGKRNPKKPRVSIGLMEIAGNCAVLPRGFPKPGFESDFFDLAPHPFDYGGDKTSSRLVSLYRWLRVERLREVWSAPMAFIKRMPGGSGQ